MNIFAIIVTYNGKQWYDRCFESLRTSEIPVKTIVIDNASADDSVEYIQSHFPDIHLIPSAANVGFGQGNNLGISYALANNADFVFLLNQDAWIEKNTIADLVQVYTSHPEFGILSPIHLNAEKTHIEEGLMHYIADYQTTSTKLIDDLYFQRLDAVYNTNYINAAAWLLPRKTLETIGGFDPIFFHYGEDDNYMQRVLYHGMQIGICPQITVCHDTEQRKIRQIFTDETSNRVLLVQSADINQEFNISKHLLYLWRKAIIHLIRGHRKDAVHFYRQASFLSQHKNKIRISKSQNRNIGPSWL